MANIFIIVKSGEHFKTYFLPWFISVISQSKIGKILFNILAFQPSSSSTPLACGGKGYILDLLVIISSLENCNSLGETLNLWFWHLWAASPHPSFTFGKSYILDLLVIISSFETASPQSLLHFGEHFGDTLNFWWKFWWKSCHLWAASPQSLLHGFT